MPPSPAVAFDQEHAAHYDQRYAKLAAMCDALHLLTSGVLGDLPAEARILCVGAGTGQELLYLAKKFPQWRFVAVEPSGAMLAVCRNKAEEAGIAGRCFFHEGYLASLPAAEPFDAATALLVSQFIMDTAARVEFYRLIAGRLQPGGYVVSADLATDLASESGRSLMEVWLRLLQETGLPREQFDRLRTSYGRDVAVLPPAQVRALIAAGGFAEPVQFLQTVLIHAWYARRPTLGG